MVKIQDIVILKRIIIHCVFVFTLVTSAQEDTISLNLTDKTLKMTSQLKN